MIKKILKYLINFAAIFALAVTSAALYESEFLYGYKGDSVVMLRTGRGGGTGFRITAPSGQSYIMTNNHICKDNKTLTAYWKDQSREVLVIEKYAEHDLCLVEDIEDIPSLRLSGSISERERIWLIGHPALRKLTLESGHFVGNTDIKLWTTCNQKEISEQIDKYDPIESDNVLEDIIMFAAGYCLKTTGANYINNISYPGNSGSPVLNKWGDVVGVLFAGMRGQPTASYMVPIEHLHKFLRGK